MKNKITDLNNHLFEQLERLNDDTLSGDALISEIHRAGAMTGIAAQLVQTHKVMIDAMKLTKGGYSKEEVLQVFTNPVQKTIE
jgi:uncharacterized protein related to proFAR isomerase